MHCSILKNSVSTATPMPAHSICSAQSVILTLACCCCHRRAMTGQRHVLPPPKAVLNPYLLFSSEFHKDAKVDSWNASTLIHNFCKTWCPQQIMAHAFNPKNFYRYFECCQCREFGGRVLCTGAEDLFAQCQIWTTILRHFFEVKQHCAFTKTPGVILLLSCIEFSAQTG